MRRSLFPLILVTLLPSCGDTATAPPPVGNIAGRVTVEREGINGVSVTLVTVTGTGTEAEDGTTDERNRLGELPVDRWVRGPRGRSIPGQRGSAPRRAMRPRGLGSYASRPHALGRLRCPTADT